MRAVRRQVRAHESPCRCLRCPRRRRHPLDQLRRARGAHRRISVEAALDAAERRRRRRRADVRVPVDARGVPAEAEALRRRLPRRRARTPEHHRRIAVRRLRRRIGLLCRAALPGGRPHQARHRRRCERCGEDGDTGGRRRDAHVQGQDGAVSAEHRQVRRRDGQRGRCLPRRRAHQRVRAPRGRVGVRLRVLVPRPDEADRGARAPLPRRRRRRCRRWGLRGRARVLPRRAQDGPSGGGRGLCARVRRRPEPRDGSGAPRRGPDGVRAPARSPHFDGEEAQPLQEAQHPPQGPEVPHRPFLGPEAHRRDTEQWGIPGPV
eukprot:PhM_4_TR18852/c0_g2_i1/m.43433